jgi:hypothetical protein
LRGDLQVGDGINLAIAVVRIDVRELKRDCTTAGNPGTYWMPEGLTIATVGAWAQALGRPSAAAMAVLSKAQRRIEVDMLRISCETSLGARVLVRYVEKGVRPFLVSL